MANILTLEEDLDQSATKTNNFKTKAAKKTAAEKTPAKVEYKGKNTNSERLTQHADELLEYHLKKTPQYKILTQQILLLKDELAIYKKCGAEDKFEATKALIVELSVSRTRIAKVFKNKQDVKKGDLREAYKNSPELQDLLKEQKQLIIALQESTPSWYVKVLTNYRKQIELRKNVDDDKENVEDFDTFENVEDLDDLLDSAENNDENLQDVNNNQLQQEYYNFCGKIGDIIGYTAKQVSEAVTSQIHKELKQYLDNADIKDDVLRNKLLIGQAKNKIAGNTSVTDIMFEIFDFQEEETVPKEILAASSLGLVRAIAYNTASKMGALDKLDDAVSYGLLGLTVAINAWYKSQKMSDSALTFTGFSNSYVVGSIKRGLLEQNSTYGTMSPSSLATLMTKEKKKIEDFVRFNPEFKNFDKEMLTNMLSGYDGSDKPLNIIGESDLAGIIGGEDGGNADIWANAIVENGNSSTFAESKLEYESLIKSIKDLLNLFESETVVNKKTGIVSIIKTKIFSKYDLKLFMMYFGLEYKIQKTDSKKGNKYNYYTQDEMAEELTEMYIANGEKPGKNGTIGGSAISTRISVLLNKIKMVMVDNPSLKKGFEYIWAHWQTNSDNMTMLSNSREELGMKFDRDELREIYADDEMALNSQLTDGTKLGDIFEISDTNPLEDEIGSMFNQLFV